MRMKILSLLTVFAVVSLTTATFNLEFFGFFNPYLGRSSSLSSLSNRNSVSGRIFNRLFNSRRSFPSYRGRRRGTSVNNGLSFFNFLNGFRTGINVGNRRRGNDYDSRYDYYDSYGYNDNYYDTVTRPFNFNYFYGRRVVNLIALSLLLTFSLSDAFVIDCYYNEWDWNFKQLAYECQGSPVDVDISPGHVVNVTGTHMTGGNATEVEALRFMHKPGVTFIPNGIGRFFPNLKGLSFLNCNIRTITKDHLAEFPEMIQVSYNFNQIEVVPGDLFIYTPKLKLVNFASNNIKRIGAGLFKPLKSLEYIWFEKNSCISMNVRRSDFKALRKEIRKSCRAGGSECKKIPRLFRKWNDPKPVDMCEMVQVYRFKPKPRHELIKNEREKAEKTKKEEQDYLDLVLKVCEHPDVLYRFFEAVYCTKEIKETNDEDIRKAFAEENEKRIIEGIVSVSNTDKKKKKKKNSK